MTCCSNCFIFGQRKLLGGSWVLLTGPRSFSFLWTVSFSHTSLGTLSLTDKGVSGSLGLSGPQPKWDRKKIFAAESEMCWGVGVGKETGRGTKRDSPPTLSILSRNNIAPAVPSRNSTSVVILQGTPSQERSPLHHCVGRENAQGTCQPQKELTSYLVSGLR